MFEKLKHRLTGGKTLILGFGKEGQSTYKVLRKVFPGLKLTIADADSNCGAALLAAKNDPLVVISLGQGYLSDVHAFDTVIKSPGIPLKELPEGIAVEKITSQSELFLGAFRSRVTGITGTKGKSTSCSLLHHILSLNNDKAVLAGNIGIPPFDLLDDIDGETHIIFELSSHQLQQTRVSPAIAIILNIFEEHLDHYGNFSDYQQAKLNIARYQLPSDYLIYNGENDLPGKLIGELNPAGIRIPCSTGTNTGQGCFIREGKVVMMLGGALHPLFPANAARTLKGHHNLLNIMAVACAASLHGVPEAVIVQGLSTYRPLDHRIEYVGHYRDIDFYNDSIATIPEACLAAIDALGKVDTLILGGYDRGISYSLLADRLPQSGIKTFIFMGRAGQRMYNLLKPLIHQTQATFIASDFEEVIELAFRHTAPGGTCLLSPAAASYDWFRNFEERGLAYKKMVRDFS